MLLSWFMPSVYGFTGRHSSLGSRRLCVDISPSLPVPGGVCVLALPGLPLPVASRGDTEKPSS